MNEDTTVYFCDKGKPGTRVLLEVAHPAMVPVVLSLVHALLKDSRCEAICILANNVARGVFEAEFHKQDLPLTKLDRYVGLIEDIPGPFDVAVAVLGGADTPTQLMLYSSKSVFGCRKLFFIATGWLLGPLLLVNRDTMDPIDAVFAEDELAAAFFRIDLPWMQPSAIIPVGTALLDSIQKQDRAALRRTGREILAIDDKTKVLFYPSFPSDVVGSATDIAQQTLRETLEGVKKAALQNPQELYVVLVRFHPRMSKSQQQEEMIICSGEIPKNLRVILDVPSRLTYDQSIYASDAIASYAGSTLPTLAHYYGKPVLLCAYGGEGNSGDFFRQRFSPKKIEALLEIPGMVLVESGDDLAREFAKVAPIPPTSVPQPNSTEVILTHILS